MRLIIASDSTEERRQYRQAAVAAGLDCDSTDCVIVRDLPSRLRIRNADVALTTVGLDVATSIRAVQTVSAAGIPTYAVCDNASEPFVPKLVRAGAVGYLRRAEFQSDLEEMLAELGAERVRPKLGRLIALVGAQNGVGATTVATNLAFALSERWPSQVALAQLALGRPDLAMNLGLAPDTALSEVASGWPWLDATALNRLLIRYPHGPAILADLRNAAPPVQWSSAALSQLLGELRTRFAYTVVDFGPALDAAQLAALRLADTIALVLRLDMAAVMSAQILVASLAELGVSREKIVAIVNRHGQRGELSWTQVRSALGLPVGAWIPEDAENVNRAINARKPLVVANRTVPIAASFARLAAAFSRRRFVAG
jgi:pilus assembly protein CpaE